MADVGDAFEIDPGRAPRQPGKGEPHEPELEQLAAPAEPGPALGETIEGWTADGAGAIFTLSGTILNGVERLRGGGPDDVFIPTPHEVNLFGEAFARYANRHERLRAWAEKGDVGIMAVTVGQYAVREMGRAAAYREAQAEATADLRAESPAEHGAVRPENLPGGMRATEPGRRFERLDDEQ